MEWPGSYSGLRNTKTFRFRSICLLMMEFVSRFPLSMAFSFSAKDRKGPSDCQLSGSGRFSRVIFSISIDQQLAEEGFNGHLCGQEQGDFGQMSDFVEDHCLDVPI